MRPHFEFLVASIKTGSKTMKTFLLSTAVVASIVLMIAVDANACSGPNARVSPPPGAIIVDASGNSNFRGSYRTLKEGVAKLDVSTSKAQSIFVYPGVYKEQVVIPPLESTLVLQGSTCDATSYAANKVTITHAMAQKDVPVEVTKYRNALTSSVLFKSNNVKVYNLNIANTAGEVGQAVAVGINGTNYGFYGCDFSGYQDTLLTGLGNELYVNVRIRGTIDYIFGMNSSSWFERCDLDSIGKGYITANGRRSNESDSIYIFNRANVYSSNGLVNQSFLGRPWRSHSSVVFQNSELSNVVKAAGWETWNGNLANDVNFGEFNNSGPGAAKGNRVIGKHLEKAVDIEKILGDNYKGEWYVDSSYL